MLKEHSYMDNFKMTKRYILKSLRGGINVILLNLSLNYVDTFMDSNKPQWLSGARYSNA